MNDKQKENLKNAQELRFSPSYLVEKYKELEGDYGGKLTDQALFFLKYHPRFILEKIDKIDIKEHPSEIKKVIIGDNNDLNEKTARNKFTQNISGREFITANSERFATVITEEMIKEKPEIIKLMLKDTENSKYRINFFSAQNFPFPFSI